MHWSLSLWCPWGWGYRFPPGQRTLHREGYPVDWNFEILLSFKDIVPEGDSVGGDDDFIHCLWGNSKCTGPQVFSRIVMHEEWHCSVMPSRWWYISDEHQRCKIMRATESETGCSLCRAKDTCTVLKLLVGLVEGFRSCVWVCVRVCVYITANVL